MSTPMEERMDLIERIPDEPARPEEFILQELMTIAVAREVRNDDIVFAGTGLPMLGKTWATGRQGKMTRIRPCTGGAVRGRSMGCSREGRKRFAAILGVFF